MIKQYRYKNEIYNITKVWPYGYYRTYAGGRFIMADTLSGLYRMIKELEAVK